MQQKKNRQIGLCQIGYLFPLFPKKKMSNSRRENLQNELKNIFGQYFFFIQNPNRSQFNSKKTNTPIFRKQN